MTRTEIQDYARKYGRLARIENKLNERRAKVAGEIREDFANVFAKAHRRAVIENGIEAVA